MTAKVINNGASEGNSFGASITDKVSFYGVTPVVQPSSADQAAVTAGSTTTVANTALIEIRRVLVLLGMMKGAA